MEVIQTFKSKRNRVELVRTGQRYLIRKKYLSMENCLQELDIYRKIQGKQLPCAEVIAAEEQVLYLSYLRGKTIVDVLEEQEASGEWDPSVWKKLVNWIVIFQNYTARSMEDVNLRNFLYDEGTQTLYGLDFENCTEVNTAITAAKLAAFIHTYSPEYTSLKQEIAAYVLDAFLEHMDLPLPELLRECEKQEAILLERRGRL